MTGRHGRRARPIALALAGVLAAAGALLARADSAAARTTAPRAASPHATAAAARIPRLTIARLQYDGGGDWYANPSSLPNLLTAIRERTTLRPERTEAKVRLTDDQLWDYPYLHLTGHGAITMSDAEVARLRDYILRGGFLHADDNYGLDESFRKLLGRVFPDRPLVEVPLSHPIYHLVYDFPKGVPKVHQHDGKPPKGYGIFVGDRLAVYYTYESDLGNGWEDLGTYPNDPPEVHEQALRMGVNLFVYAVTSRLP